MSDPSPRSVSDNQKILESSCTRDWSKSFDFSIENFVKVIFCSFLHASPSKLVNAERKCRNEPTRSARAWRRRSRKVGRGQRVKRPLSERPMPLQSMKGRRRFDGGSERCRADFGWAGRGQAKWSFALRPRTAPRRRCRGCCRCCQWRRRACVHACVRACVRAGAGAARARVGGGFSRPPRTSGLR